MEVSRWIGSQKVEAEPPEHLTSGTSDRKYKDSSNFLVYTFDLSRMPALRCFMDTQELGNMGFSCW